MAKDLEFQDGVLNHKYLKIISEDYFGSFSISQNNNYIITWQDGYLEKNDNKDEQEPDFKNERIIFKKEIHEGVFLVASEINEFQNEGIDFRKYKWSPGKYYLLENEKVKIKGRCDRPQNGDVANNGCFVLNNRKSFAKDLSGELLIFNNIGEILIRKKFDANIINNKISKNGGHVLCQLAHSPSKDSDTIVFFNVNERRQVWQVTHPYGGADSYELDDFNKIISLILKNKGIYQYSYEGDYLGKK